MDIMEILIAEECGVFDDLDKDKEEREEESKQMNLHELCGEANFVTKDGIIFNDDCMNVLSKIGERERERERESRKQFNLFNYYRYTIQ